MNTKPHFLSVAALPAILVAGTALVLLAQPLVQEPPKESAGDSPNVVAKIGDSVITRAELEERLVREIRPHEEEFPTEAKPVTAAATLQVLLAEKAMSLEGRKLGYLKDDAIHQRVQELEQSRLAMMVQESLFPGPPAVEAGEVDRLLKERPGLKREQATLFAQRAAVLKIFTEFYGKLTGKFHLQKARDNFATAAQIHQRLLLKPVEKRGPGEYWIKNSQVRNELSEKEKSLVLATYEGGQFTLKDWFQAICNMAPPRRPSDTRTPAGVERLLDSALRLPILVAEAKTRGYDKDPKLRAEIRQREDQELLYKVQEEKLKGAKEPTAEQIKAYFEKNRERFGQAAKLKISQIWCENPQVAQEIKAALDKGENFEVLRKARSLQKDEEPHNVSAIGEGLFWADLWKADPNQTIGPIRGFYGSGVKWRIVRVLEKTPAQAQPYSEQLANSVKWTMISEQRQRLLEDYQKELLAQYPHEVCADRIKGMDPLEIAAGRKD
ncbi:MAG: peptidylprolyl isomerase [Planctomycetes bacterium]|nr:peptidylprolyl isomerase [Planctomycetota bacterium]